MTKPSETQNDADFAAQAFSMLGAVDVSPELKRRIAQIPLEHEARSKVWFWPFERVWQPTLALAAMALLGVLTGTLVDTKSSTISELATLLDSEAPVTMPADTLSPNVDQVATIGDDEELDNLLALALGQTWEESAWDPAAESLDNSANKIQEALPR